MTSSAPETNAPAPFAAPAPMAGSASDRRPNAAAIGAAVGGFIVSLVAHSIFVVWGIGLWDMATPLSAAPPPSIMVDLVDDPWRIKQAPDLQLGEPAPAAQPATPPPPVSSPVAASPAATPPAAPQQATPPTHHTAPTAPIGFPSFDSTADVPDPDTPTGLRIAQMLQVPIELPVDLPLRGEQGGGVAEWSAKLERNVIDDFKEHLRACWMTPPEAVDDKRVKVLIRVSLRRDGSLLGEPVLIQAVATPAGPAVVKSAIAAVKKCQPYAALPAEQYKQWRVLDVGFSADGVL
jgi:hypothetical protein